MTENSRTVVLSVLSFVSVEVLDGGETLAVRLKAPDDREIALLVPRQAAAALQAEVAMGLEAALKRLSGS